jgi:hypothetical protein
MIVLSSIGFGREATSGHLVDQIQGLFGVEGALFVQSLVTNAYRPDAKVLATVVSLIWSSSGSRRYLCNCGIH